MPPHGHSHDDGGHHGHSHDGGHGHSHDGAPKITHTGVTIDLHDLSHNPSTRRILAIAAICGVCLVFVVYSVSASHSLILTACMWLTIFSIMSLVSALLSIGSRKSTSSLTYTYGMARMPVLSVFATTVLAQLAAIFLVKESLEHVLEDDTHHSGASGHHQHWMYVPAVLVSALAQFLSAYAVQNEPMQHVLSNASNSWLQEQAADMSRSICYVMPGLARFLLPRLNALGLLTANVTGVCLLAHYLLVSQHCWWADAVGTFVSAPSNMYMIVSQIVSVCIVGAMLPLSTYTGRILLQTTPPHMQSQLEKCVRECETLPGVLELTHAQFWQLDYKRMCGTVVVRCSRDADQQTVLAHVTEKLGAVIQDLTVAIDQAPDYAAHPQSWSAPQQVQHVGQGGHGHSHDGGGHHGHSH